MEFEGPLVSVGGGFMLVHVVAGVGAGGVLVLEFLAFHGLEFVGAGGGTLPIGAIVSSVVAKVDSEVLLLSHNLTRLWASVIFLEFE